MRTFFIRSKNERDKASLYVKVQRRKPALQLLVNSRIQVDIPTWKRAISSQNAWNRFIGTVDGKAVSELMQKVDSAIDNLLQQEIYDKVSIDEAVADVVFAEERSMQRQKEEEAAKEIQRQAELRAKAEEERKADVVLYLSQLIDGMKDGTIKNKGKNYSPNTIKMWNNFLGIIKRFHAGQPFSWNDINKGLADRFILFMENEGYMASAINKYITTFRAMVGYAMDAEWHDNAKALSSFSKRKINAEEKACEIYLTADELQALYEMQLDGLKGIIKDVFLVGCYTCQRFSDYSRLEKSNFTTTPRGTKIVRLVQQKTRTEVVVPVLNDNLMAIAEKYDYDMPTVNEQVLNRYIKDVLKELSQSVPSLGETRRTILTMKERAKEERGEIEFERDARGYVVKPRYELVSSHTARRSGITNLYLTGLFDDRQMMSISGHKDLSTFSDYIKLSSEEIADGIAEKAAKAKNTKCNEDLF